MSYAEPLESARACFVGCRDGKRFAVGEVLELDEAASSPPDLLEPSSGIR